MSGIMTAFLQNLHLLLPIAVGVTLMLKMCQSQPPTVMECSRNDGDIVIFNSSFWFECEKGRQVHKHCVIYEDKGIAGCIPTKNVVENLHKHKEGWFWDMFLPRFMDKALTIPHCWELNKELPTVMYHIPEKDDCLKGYETKNISNVDDMSPCKIKNRNAFLLNEKGWFKCEDDGSAPLQSCAFKFPDDNQYWCMDIQQIIALFSKSDYYQEMDEGIKSNNSSYFCKDLEKILEYTYPDYKKELTSCNDKSVKYGQTPISIQSQTNAKTETIIEESVIVDPEPEGEVKTSASYIIGEYGMRKALPGQRPKHPPPEMDPDKFRYSNMKSIFSQFQSEADIGMDLFNTTTQDSKVENVGMDSSIATTQASYIIGEYGMRKALPGQRPKHPPPEMDPDKFRYSNMKSIFSQFQSEADIGMDLFNTTTQDSKVENVGMDSSIATTQEVIPYPGGNKGKKMVDNCREDPAFDDDYNCYYKCGMPYMCRVNSGYCLSFYVVEYMFRTYHNENNKNISRPYGAWSDEKFESISEGLEDAEQAVYKELQQHKERTNYYLFQTLAQVFKMLIGEEAYKEETDSQVTIKVGNVATRLELPNDVTYIIEYLAPFYDDFIEKYTESCPEVDLYI